jgi:hypothetical protein
MAYRAIALDIAVHPRNADASITIDEFVTPVSLRLAYGELDVSIV